MTANLAPDPERVLDGYAEATRIFASAQLVRRFQSGIADERAREARRPWSGAIAPVRGARLRLTEPFSIAFAPHVTFALRLQSLALVLLTVLALSAVVGGAGAMLIEVVNDPHRGVDVPGRVWAPAPSDVGPLRSPFLPPRSSMVVPSPSASPAVTTRVLAQREPRSADRTRADRRRSRAGWQPHVMAVACRLAGHWSRDHHCAS